MGRRGREKKTKRLSLRKQETESSGGLFREIRWRRWVLGCAPDYDRPARWRPEQINKGRGGVCPAITNSDRPAEGRTLQAWAEWAKWDNGLI